MKVVNFTKKQFENMEKLPIHNTIYNTEGDIFMCNIKEDWEKNPKLLKIFYIREGEYFANKQAVINTLDYCRDDLNIPELVLPEKKVTIANEEVGYSMPYIKDGINMLLILSHPDISVKLKKEYLIKIGKAIRKIHNIKALKNEFFLGDLHEGNILYEPNEDKIKIIDIDSCKIKSSYPFDSKYLVTNKNLDKKELKHKYVQNYKKQNIPNKNTDYLCYITMILNTISGSNKIQRLDMNEYYLYLELLSDNNFPIKMLDEFAKIYMGIDNKNVVDYLEEIPEDLSGVKYDDFIKRVRK